LPPDLKKITPYLLLFTSFFLASEAGAQYFKLKGTVYDSTRTFPIVSVTVLTSSGKGAVTDSYGHYEIDVRETDSVWFSYLNKATIKYAVGKVFDASRFDIAIHINIPTLKEVIVKPRNYKMDSIQNRLDYAKAFNWEKPGLKTTAPGSLGEPAGIDLGEIIRMFQFRKNRSMASFKERLLQEERDKFIEHRFNKALVLRLTGLIGEERDSFMLRCRPNYEFCLYTSDYDFQYYIKKCYESYRLEKTDGWLRKEN
jgi:hypothetical protein